MSAPTVDDLTHEWQEWRRGREASLSDPHGFLAVTSLNWLTEEPQRFPDAPGEWSTGPEGPTVVLGPDEKILVDGVTRIGRHAFGVIPERDGIDVVWGEAVIEVARRGGFDIVRPRHPDSARLQAYTSTPAYEPQPRWVLEARYRPFDQPRPVKVDAAVEGLEHIYQAPGELSFEIDGQPLTLTAFEGRTPGSLLVLFTDATSGVTTYAANRSLPVPVPDEDGHVVLDFNRAANLPCAYTPLATCPLPPPENRLPVAVEAGEKTPHQNNEI
ncbi:hypothetical protein Kisp01_39670 [Kineosporia sp. NBRC 101677]|uniref:DUF1684 domain-containing protein n=1 Tax=Kineosporia sp. NBRC 101677 TaxID=3032197 RepID=UPI00249FBD0E|nr:DUF1684 domain-containing protein [Kineosporia sp. NBRC 101677]GLY16952.1 hypothetical protein Kisp01_39670 [Kineosporia sp. NBRC 101677]